MSRLQETLQEFVEQKVFPGVAAGCINLSGERLVVTEGRTMYDPSSPEVSSDTLYDCASLTKTFPTTTLALLLEKQGLWKLSDPLAQWLPEWHGDSSITIHDLVTFRPEFGLTLSRLKHLTAQEMLDAILHAPLTSPVGSRPPIYSNTSSILLTLALESTTQKSLEHLAQEQLFSPLRLQRTTFRPLDHVSLREIAPTEYDEWRGHMLHGELHDESAWVLQQSGKFMGSAGIFSCLDDILTFLHWHLNTLQDPRGWEHPPLEWRGTLSPSTYGKTGFTGCCMAIDPEQQRGYVILSNAVHPQRPVERETISRVRSKILSGMATGFAQMV